MPNRKITQNDRIIKYMQDYGSITSAEAMQDLGVYRLASRIHDLRDRGIGIIKEMETAKNRYGDNVSYARYRLEDLS